MQSRISKVFYAPARRSDRDEYSVVSMQGYGAPRYQVVLGYKWPTSPQYQIQEQSKMIDLKKVLSVVPAPPRHWVGDGLPVHNLIDYNNLGVRLNPFIMLDYGAPYHFEPSHRPRGVGMHPHRGFETVTIAFQGEITHTDNTGSSDTIHPGDVQWMTAGSGLEHSEMHSDSFTRTGGALEMLQLWVNLPAKNKLTKPGYQAITSESIPSIPLDEGDGTLNVIAGEYHGRKGPATTFTPVNLFSIGLKGETSTSLKVPEGWVGAVLVRNGQVTVNGKSASGKSLVALDGAGSTVQISTKDSSEFVFMAGEPIDEPIFAYGPMVMNTRQEIMQAFKDYQDGKFVLQPSA